MIIDEFNMSCPCLAVLILYVPGPVNNFSVMLMISCLLGLNQYLPVRKGPAGIQVNLNTWNLKKSTGGFFSPSHEMEYRWKAI